MNEFNDVVGTRASEEKKEVASRKEVSDALGLAFLNAAASKDRSAVPKSWKGVVAKRAAKWIDAGWSEQMIVSETERIITSLMPNSINYFEKVFAQAHADGNRALPVVATPLPGVAQPVRSNRRPSVSDALDGLISQERGRGRPRSTSDAYDRLRQQLEQGGSDNIFGPAPKLQPPQ